MPLASEIHALLRKFSGEEWIHFLVELLGTYSFSQEELALIRNHGERHIECLQRVLVNSG